jgi:hypothetical protein
MDVPLSVMHSKNAMNKHVVRARICAGRLIALFLRCAETSIARERGGSTDNLVDALRGSIGARLAAFPGTVASYEEVAKRAKKKQKKEEARFPKTLYSQMVTGTIAWPPTCTNRNAGRYQVVPFVI